MQMEIERNGAIFARSVIKMETITVKKVGIKHCIRNAKKLKWKPKRIAETLHYLGFSDKEIEEAM